MANEAQQIGFNCPKCSAELAWYPQVAGRRVSCPCGHVFVAPMRSAVVAAEPPPPPRESPKRAESLASIYGRPRRRVVEDDEEAGGPVRNVIAPTALIALGLLIASTQITWRPREIPFRMDISPAQMLVILVALVVTLLAAVGAIVAIMNIDLGRLGPAIYKLCSIPLFGGAIAIAVARLDRDTFSITGLAMGWHLMVLIYWGAVSYLFKLELWETILICFSVAVVQALALWAIMG
jgi:hypothetical protein